MTRPADDRKDAEHDAWLRAALRHAPDAELGAPLALSAAILREAGAARAISKPGSAWQPLLDLWSWLTRPPVAAGFASVMVATVVGLMWWDRPLDEALPRMAEDTRVAAPKGAAPAPAPQASASTAPLQVAVADAAPAAEKSRAAAPRPPTRPPAVTSRSEARTRDADAAAAERAVLSGQRDLEARRSFEPRAEPEVARKLADAAAAAPPPLQAAPPAAPAGLAAAARIARPAASPSASSFAAWRAEILAQPERWAWKLGTGAAQTMTPALQAWLARVDALIAGAAPLQQAAPEGNTMPLQLLRDGRLHTRLILGETGLWLLPAEAGRAPLSVALSPETAAALKAALEEALR